MKSSHLRHAFLLDAVSNSTPLTPVTPVVGVVELNFDLESTLRAVKCDSLVARLEFLFLAVFGASDANSSFWSFRSLDFVGTHRLLMVKECPVTFDALRERVDAAANPARRGGKVRPKEAI